MNVLRITPFINLRTHNNWLLLLSSAAPEAPNPSTHAHAHAHAHAFIHGYKRTTPIPETLEYPGIISVHDWLASIPGGMLRVKFTHRSE